MSARNLTRDEKIDWLCLFRTENVGPITFYRLLERFGSAKKALAALPDLARKGGRFSPLKAVSRTDAEKELAAIDALGGTLLARGEPEYPANLAAIEDAPPLLTALGDTTLLNQPCVAVVGARNASANGRKMAETFARELGRGGYRVVSGLARGIDTSAHEGALGTGTVAVVAGGIDVIYPRENTLLYQSIARSGCIVAESPLGTQPAASHFPRRNRIISGICLGVLVIEAAAKSGSLITARLAAEQGREVFAVPGSPMDPRSEGANLLIRDGAHMTIRPDDVLDILKSLKSRSLSDRAADFDLFGERPAPAVSVETQPDLRAKISELLGHEPADIDDIIRLSGQPPALVLTALLELEIAGHAERHPGNKVSLTSSQGSFFEGDIFNVG